MTQKEKVLNYLGVSFNLVYCDDCLSERLDIKPRQTVNYLCNLLYKKDLINRVKDQCNDCSKDKLVNSHK